MFKLLVNLAVRATASARLETAEVQVAAIAAAMVAALLSVTW
jgi:hypothetical protein